MRVSLAINGRKGVDSSTHVCVCVWCHVTSCVRLRLRRHHLHRHRHRRRRPTERELIIYLLLTRSNCWESHNNTQDNIDRVLALRVTWMWIYAKLVILIVLDSLEMCVGVGMVTAEKKNSEASNDVVDDAMTKHRRHSTTQVQWSVPI